MNRFDNLIIHIHGGGFISQSSFSHQLYTRRWATLIPKSVIFSIDYRLAPKYRFPDPVDDVWQAYVWILTYAKEILGIDYKKVVVTGDSAGGTLSICLTLMAIKRGFRVPDGLHPIYPSVVSTRNHFTPSVLNAWDDMLLSAAFLNYVLRSYQPTDPENFYLGSKHCYLSPLLADNSDLSKLPKTRIAIAGIDPLRDDSILLLNKLLSLSVDAKAIEFSFLPHGFMSFKLPLGQGIDEALEAIEKSAEVLRELLGIEDGDEEPENVEKEEVMRSEIEGEVLNNGKVGDGKEVIKNE